MQNVFTIHFGLGFEYGPSEINTYRVSIVRSSIHDLIHDGRTKRGARELATSKWLN